jgi:UDP-N-acetylmuramyl tripeptide synthase
MTGEFRRYIEQIRNKSLELHQSLVVERERANSYVTEISRLETLLEEQVQTVEELRAQNAELQQLLNEQREQVRQQPPAEVSKDAAIDGLVKEIDFCIQQLKIANE